jgi:hypothetical protein
LSEKDEDIWPEGWEKYQRMVDVGPDLASELEQLLLSKKYWEADLLLQNEDVDTVEHVLFLLYEQATVSSFIDLLVPLAHICLSQLPGLEEKSPRQDLSRQFLFILHEYMNDTKRITQNAIDHINSSQIGTDRLKAATAEKHQELLFKAYALKAVNQRLSKSRIAQLLISRGETDYSVSTILEILKGLEEFSEWEALLERSA